MKAYRNYAIVIAFGALKLVACGKSLISVLALSVTAPWLPAMAQQMCLPTDLSPPALPTAVAAPDGQRIQITAGGVDLSRDEGIDFFDQVAFQYGNRRISAERATFDRATQRLDVQGTVAYQDPEVSVYGEDAEVDTQGEVITFSGGGFDLPSRPARGAAETIRIQGDNTISLDAVNFTTCPAERADWELRARELEMDIESGFATARGVRLNFKGVPILAAPYMTFPIDNRRRSGLLTPNLSNRDRTGLDISIPYYLNLAPNYDMTIVPRYLQDRGAQVTTEFRYLFSGTQGQLDFEYIPDDAQMDLSRSYLSLAHDSPLGRAWRVIANIQHVSDDNYFEDLGNSLSVASQTHLDRRIDFTYRAPRWSLLARLQAYQTIDPSIAAVDEPYQRVPQFLFSGRWDRNVVRFDSDNELVNFQRDVGATGWRMDLTEELALAFARPGMFLTPAVALRQTNYWLDEERSGGATTELARTLPVGSIDAGLTFERPGGMSGSWLQTIEPRMLYVHVPFEDHTEFPVFDTIEPTFNLVQLFRKYRYLGADRVADADRLSFGVTTRLIDVQTGQERLTATLGQTRYLSGQGVTLPGARLGAESDSDYIAEVAISLRPAWRLGVDYQWDSETSRRVRSETRFQYRPRADRLFGIAHRYQAGLLEQGDLSLVWPLGQASRVIAQTSYSFLDEKPLERFLGWEYESCCWRLRLIGRRYISRRTGESDSSFTIQFQLRGFTDEGESPEALLDRGILGYRQFDNVP